MNTFSQSEIDLIKICKLDLTTVAYDTLANWYKENYAMENCNPIHLYQVMWKTVFKVMENRKDNDQRSILEMFTCPYLGPGFSIISLGGMGTEFKTYLDGKDYIWKMIEKFSIYLTLTEIQYIPDYN